MAWSGLPQDILRLVFEKLYLVDRIRFRAVCKDWFLASIQFHEVQPVNKQLPWMMSFRFTRRSERVCLLFEPFCRKPYVLLDEEKTINIIEDEAETKRRRRRHVKPSSCLSIVAANRSGWVLLLTGAERISWTEGSVMSYQLYNPLTGKVIELPDLRLPNYPPTDLAALSSDDPTSTTGSCVIFVVPGNFEGDEIRISTYTVVVGDDESESESESSWKTHTFTCPDAARYSVEGVVYMEGDRSFYCFSGGEEGLLSSFNVAAQEWKPLTTTTTANNNIRGRCPKPDWFMSYSPFFDEGRGRPGNRFFLEYGGRLIIAYTMWGAGYEYPPPWVACEIFSFDLKDRIWIKMDSLEGGALFLGQDQHRICIGVPAGAGAGDKTKMIANKVYYFRGNDSRPTFLTYGGPGPVFSDQCPSEQEEEEEERMVDYSNAWDHVQPLHHDLHEDRIWIHPPLLPSTL